MITTKGMVALASAVLLAGATATWVQMSVEADKENVVASRLEGKWELDSTLTKRLGGGAEGSVTFRADQSIPGKIPAQYQTFLKDKVIYLAGVMEIAGRNGPEGTRSKVEYPFILIDHHGNPHVVFFRERDGDPMGDGESFNLMLAPASDKSNDLLFVGGDFNNQPFSAFRRVKLDAK